MKISPYGLSPDETRSLIKGRLTPYKCHCCDNEGLVYYDSSVGEGVSSSPSNINPKTLAVDRCDECNGYGYLLKESK